MNRIVQTNPSDLEQLEKIIGDLLPSIIDSFSKIESPSVEKDDDFISLITAFPIFAMTTDLAVLKADSEGRNQLSETWNAARERMKDIPVPDGFEPLTAKIIEKRGRCDLYNVGDTFQIESPFYWPKACSAIWFSAWPFLIAAGFGFEGWEGDNPYVYRISCPSKLGVVVEFIQAKRLR